MYKISYRKRFKLSENYVPWLLSGRKWTTIRYVKGSIDLPATRVMKVFASNIDTGEYSKKSACRVKIESIVIKPFWSLNQSDAQHDGFSDVYELAEALRRIYSGIKGDDLVTIYYLTVIK